MTIVALQARVRSLELDGKDQREALEKIEALQGSLASVVDRLTKRVDDLAAAGGQKAKDRIEAVEARVAETTRMQLELAAHDDRIEALEEARSEEASSGDGATSDELLSLDARLGAIETTLSEGASAAELARRLEAAEVGLADAQRALADTQAELKRRDAEVVALLRRLEALERTTRGSPMPPTEPEAEVRVLIPDSMPPVGEPKSEPEVPTRAFGAAFGGGESESPSDSEPVSEATDYARESAVGSLESESPTDSQEPAPESEPPVALTDVKGIGPKLSKKLGAAGLEDARVLAAMDDDALDSLAEASGIARGRLERLRDAAQDL